MFFCRHFVRDSLLNKGKKFNRFHTSTHLLYNSISMEIEAKELKKSGAWLLFSFKGRISRKPFWIFNLFIFLAGILFAIFTEPAENINEITKSQFLFMLWMLWPSMAVQAKRWHDRNKSALWLLINFIPIAGPLWSLIENGFLPGTPGTNKFGPDPMETKEES